MRRIGRVMLKLSKEEHYFFTKDDISMENRTIVMEDNTATIDLTTLFGYQNGLQSVKLKIIKVRFTSCLEIFNVTMHK